MSDEITIPQNRIRIGDIVLRDTISIGASEYLKTVDKNSKENDLNEHFVSQHVQLTTWLMDDEALFENGGKKDKTKEQKFKELYNLFKKGEFSGIQHDGLNARGFDLGRITKFSEQYFNNYIEVSMEIQQQVPSKEAPGKKTKDLMSKIATINAAIKALSAFKKVSC